MWLGKSNDLNDLYRREQMTVIVTMRVFECGG